MPATRPRFEGLYVSVSQIKTYLRCPRQYELRYVRGETPAFVPVALAFGSAFHAALAHFYAVVKDTRAPPPIGQMVEIFVTSWEAAAAGAVPLQADDEHAGINLVEKGKAMLVVFYEHATRAPVDVLDVERDFSVALHDPVTGEALEERLVGAIDLVIKELGRNVVVEHKSSARRWTNDQITYDFQATAYHLAARQLGLGDVGLRLQVVTKAKQPVVQVEDVERGRRDEDDIMRIVVGVLRAIDARAFFPVRGWQCRSCPWSYACRSKREHE